MKITELKKQVGNDEIFTTVVSLVLNCGKSQVFNMQDISDKDAARVINICEDYKNGTPIAYLTNKWFFCELPFYITKDVLVPRFETELLVSEVIKTAPETVLDLGTGSGCIAVAVAKKLPSAVVMASDISKAALEVAKENAKRNNVKIDFFRSDLFEAFDSCTFDVIVSNPPYVKTQEIGKEDMRTLNEPRSALDGGVDGLDFYRKIAFAAPNYLSAGGSLVLEVGFDQSGAVQMLLLESGFTSTEVVKDLCGHERVIIAKI